MATDVKITGVARLNRAASSDPRGARLSAMLEIVVDVGVSGLNEFFDETNYFFKFVTFD